MKLILAVFLSFVLLLVVVLAGVDSKSENSYVQCSVAIKQKSLRPGTATQLLISLRPKKGIHINLDPPLQVKLDSAEIVSSVGKPEIPRRDTVLDLSKPVRLSVTISPKAKPGSFTVRGTVTYFYCSETEGWCSRFKQPIEFKLTVVR